MSCSAFPSTSVYAMGLFTFLPQCTVHNMCISELGVPVYSSLDIFYKIKKCLVFYEPNHVYNNSLFSNSISKSLNTFHSLIRLICKVSRNSKEKLFLLIF